MSNKYLANTNQVVYSTVYNKYPPIDLISISPYQYEPSILVYYQWLHRSTDSYRHSLLYGVPENLLRKVQSVQNAAARLLTSARRCDHITPL